MKNLDYQYFIEKAQEQGINKNFHNKLKNNNFRLSLKEAVDDFLEIYSTMCLDRNLFKRILIVISQKEYDELLMVLKDFLDSYYNIFNNKKFIFMENRKKREALHDAVIYKIK